MIFLIISSYSYGFMHIVWDLLGRISGSSMFALMFLTLFSLSYFHTYGYTLLYKYSCYRPPVLEYWERELLLISSTTLPTPRLVCPSSTPRTCLVLSTENRLCLSSHFEHLAPAGPIPLQTCPQPAYQPLLPNWKLCMNKALATLHLAETRPTSIS